MKQYLQIIFALFFTNFFYAQNSEWSEIKHNYFYKVIVEDSNKFMKDGDNIILTTFEIEETKGNIKKFDFGKLLFGEKITYENLISKLNVQKSKLKLKKNSEYLIKIDLPKIEIYEYNIYLSDSIKSEELEELQEYLKSNYLLENIKYISKEDATKEAKEKLGIDATELFEENIFPASIELTSKKTIDEKEIQNKFSKIIDDFRNNQPELKSMTLKIKT